MIGIAIIKIVIPPIIENTSSISNKWIPIFYFNYNEDIIKSIKFNGTELPINF